MDAKKEATNLIKSYVLRGDSYDSLKGSHLGSYSGGIAVHIGGYIDGKKIGNDKIIVTETIRGGREVHNIFSLQQIYDEIKSNQLKLF